MSSIPYVDQRVSSGSGGQFVDFGSGRHGVKLQGGVTPYAALIPRVCATFGETVSIIATAEVRSTLQFTHNGFEGFGLGLMTFDDDGNPIWFNDPVAAGNLEWFVSALPTDWANVSITVQVPLDMVGPWIMPAFICRGTGGEVDINLADMRSHYRLLYGIPQIPAARYTSGFSIGTEPQLIGGRLGNLARRFLRTDPARIPSGASVTIRFSVFINEAYGLRSDGTRAPSFAFIAFKVRHPRPDGGFNFSWYHRLLDVTASTTNNGQIDGSRQVLTDQPIDQIETILGVATGTTSIVNAVFDHDGADADFELVDQVVTGGNL